jgi:hypothetical protein
VDKFTLPPAALPIGDASLTHLIKLATHSTTSPTPFVFACFQASAAPRRENPNSDKKDALFGLDTQITIFYFFFNFLERNF